MLLGTLRRLAERSGEPLIGRAATQAMRLLGRQFVMGRTIEDALARAGEGEERRYRHSFDMLGEAACTRSDAERYCERYREAIRAVGAAMGGAGPEAGPGISVKLSALHPRFELAQYGRLSKELLPRLRALALDAKRVNIGLMVDAEEAERLDLQTS
jgi:RHH-type proline utilization regulon transcriptional repressor/proline dehydrogenase/delta 1-pyrroline-5-carboxylate dehydrogenase